MRWFRWGRQASVYGLPLGFVLLAIACIHFYPIAGVLQLFRDQSRVPSMGACSLDTNGWSWVQNLFLLRIVVSLLWSIHIIFSVAVWQRTQWFARLMFLYAPFYYGFDLVIVGYTLYAYFTPGHVMEERLSFILRYYEKAVLQWPISFWVYFSIALLLKFLLAVITVDTLYSYLQILEVGGNGWERKAFYEIHQASNDTVETLQEHWDKRMGIKVPERSGDSDDEDTDELTGNEQQPLLFGGYLQQQQQQRNHIPVQERVIEEIV